MISGPFQLCGCGEACELVQISSGNVPNQKGS